MCKVSVIIPVFQAEKYLQKCLSSILNQTMRDIEILCFIHDSADGSLKILEKNAALDKRLHITQLENVGVSKCRNEGISCAKGEYLYFMDADDVLNKHALKKLYKIAKKHDCDIVAFGAKIRSKNRVPIWIRETANPKRCLYTHFVPEILFSQRGAKPFVWNKFYNRSFIQKRSCLFSENISFGEDMHFQFVTLSKAQRVYFIPNHFYTYHYLNENSATEAAMENLDFRIGQHQKIVHEIFKDLDAETVQKIFSHLTKWYIEFLSQDIKQLSPSSMENEIIKIENQIDMLGVGSVDVRKYLAVVTQQEEISTPNTKLQLFFLCWKKYGARTTIEYLIDKYKFIIREVQ